jgi:hypothetical protein
MRVDITGNFWDTVFDVISLCASVVDVVQNPDDIGAWVGLACDVVDVVVPVVSGLGETARAILKLLIQQTIYTMQPKLQTILLTVLITQPHI